MTAHQAHRNAIKPSSTRLHVGWSRIVLLFGTAAVAIGLLLYPILTEKYNESGAQTVYHHTIDPISTGSINGPYNSFNGSL